MLTIFNKKTMLDITNKEEIHISFLKELLEMNGYKKDELDLTTDDIEIEGRYINLNVDNTDFSISLDEYIEYRNWWIALEREEKINSILNED